MGEVRPLFRPGEREDEPPHSLEAEQAILGAILDNNRRFVQAETLRPEHFYDAMHGALFAEIARRVLANQLANAITLQPWLISVTQQAMSQEAASRYLVGLSGRMIGGDIDHYVQHIRRLWTRRQLMDRAEELKQAATNLECEIGESSIKIIDEIDASLTDQTDALDVSFDDALGSAMKRVHEAKARGGHGGLIVPQFPRLNKRIAFLPKQFTILGGQSGEGKSALAWQIAISIAEKMRDDIANGRPKAEVGGIVGLSFEMSEESLANRALSAETGIPVHLIETSVLSDGQIEALEQARGRLAKLPMRLICVGGLTPTMIRMRMRQARRKLGGHVALTVIDHVQLVEADDKHASSGGAWATGKVADAILSLSKEFNTHVLALSQVDIKDIAKRTEKRPTKADLRWSANFAQNADNILFIHRPEEHMPKAPPTQEEMEPDFKYEERVQSWHELSAKLAGKAELIADKVRQGASKWVLQLFFDGPTTSFSENPEHD